MCRACSPEDLQNGTVCCLFATMPRLLRVFYLAPGVAERCALESLCSALQRRVSLMKPVDLQLVLADLAAIYTPRFLPLFASAARALRRGQEARAVLAARGEKAAADHSEGGLTGSCVALRGEEGAEFVSPLQAAFLLHSYGEALYPPSAKLAMRRA